MGYDHGTLYFNMGNCYYKQREIGLAILYYERAKRLIPDHEDLKANMALANLNIVDKISPRPQFILFRIVNGFVNLFPRPILISIVTALYLVFMILITLWLLLKRGPLRRLMIRIGILMGILLLIFTLSLTAQWINERNTTEAIILTEKVDVMSAPGKEGAVEVFALHEGTKVFIDQTSGEWVEIILSDGKVGWLKKEDLEII
jgi:hypothetical protein